MTTIDKLDIDAYIRYAQLTTIREQVGRMYRIEQDMGIAPQVQVLNLYPEFDQIDILLGYGVTAVRTPWAHLLPPKGFRSQRRSPFAFSRLAPGILDLGEGEESAEARLGDVVCSTSNETREKETLLNCFGELKKLNEMLKYVFGQMGRFLQG